MTNCIPWPSALAHGYPSLHGTLIRRRVYQEHYGLPPASSVYTICGQKECINHQHLTLQRPSCEATPTNAALSPQQAQAIKDAYYSYPRPTYSALASAWTVSVSTIRATIVGLTYHS